MMNADLKRTNEIIKEQLQSDVPLIPQLADYLIAAGGKRIRPLLTLASSALMNDSADDLQADPNAALLAASVEFIHSATLLHDDVVDESTERRGQPSANTIFGNLASVLVGDFLFSRAFELMVKAGSMDVLRILSRAAATIAEGEVMQLNALSNLDLKQEDYLAIIGAKTSALFGAACGIGPYLANKPDHYKALHDYGYALGLVFQIVDDVLDYMSDTAALGKDIGNDFREGKVTLPVLLAYEKSSAAEKEFWQRAITQPQNQTAHDLATAKTILLKYDIPSACMAMANDYAATAKNALQSLPASALRQTMADVVDFCIDRKS